MKTILICGATGFIGRNLVNYFSQGEYSIVAIYNKKKPFVTNENVKWVKADLTKADEIKNIIQDIDIIIQAAATTSGSKDIVSQPYIHTTDNAVMNSLLFREAFHNDIKHIIFFSCTVMLQSSELPQTEDDFDASLPINEKYYGVAHTKLYIEKMCQFYSSISQTKYTAVRHSNIYGPYDKFDLEKSHVFGASVTKVMNAKDKITVWDIRPENTCNLKCVMCNPRNSSKWAEDIDLFLKYADKENNPEKLARLKKEFSIRKTLDWDWILERCINTAEKIYIAGGEPFYMKSVHDFLDKLSKQKWNRQNTRIEIQTNGVSNTDRFLSILEKFDNLMFLMSVDGWGSVNELIRFPTKHEVFVSNVEQLTSLTDQFSFNITVQALNLPNVDKTVKKLSKWGHCSMHKLWTPDYLDINCLAPVIIKEVSKSTDLPQIKGYIDDYEYNHNLRNKMLQYLKELDKARGTNSKKVLPWCYRAF